MANYVSREVYKINQSTGAKTYAGYARFDLNGKYLGSKGGYGPRKQGINPDSTGNKKTNNASMVQNTVRVAGASGAKRNLTMRSRRF